MQGEALSCLPAILIIASGCASHRRRVNKQTNIILSFTLPLSAKSLRQAAVPRCEVIGGVFESMEKKRLQCAKAACVCDHSTKGPILLGVAATPFEENEAHQESVLNPNYLSKYIDLDERSKSRGGRQSPLVDGIEIPILMD